MCNMSDLVEARGEEKKAREMALEMLRDGMPHKKVAEYAKVSVETVMQWEEEACCKA